jgi:nucleoid DNA-binding protein
MPKQIIIQKLMDREGCTEAEARTIVEAVIDAWKQALALGKDIEIEGLGTLSVVERKPRRRIERNLKNVGPTILTVNKQSKTVKLRSRRDLYK